MSDFPFNPQPDGEYPGCDGCTCRKGWCAINAVPRDPRTDPKVGDEIQPGHGDNRRVYEVQKSRKGVTIHYVWTCGNWQHKSVAMSLTEWRRGMKRAKVLRTEP